MGVCVSRIAATWVALLAWVAFPARGLLTSQNPFTTAVAMPSLMLPTVSTLPTVSKLSTVSPSPRTLGLMPPPRDTLLTPTNTLVTMKRGPLTPRLTPTSLLTSLTLPTVSLPGLSPLDPPPVWTPSPRALMHPPREPSQTSMASSSDASSWLLHNSL